jgi:diguanylate cyclase (GGDEF)-like protein
VQSSSRQSKPDKRGWRDFARRIDTAHAIAGAYVALALLTYWSSNSPVAFALYLMVMLHGVLRLQRTPLVILAAVALVLHGTTLFILIDSGYRLSATAAWIQVGALAAAFAWFIFSAGPVQRLRSRLIEARGKLHDLEADANERASRDALTGAYVRHHLIDALEREIARAERIGKPLSIARIDLDGLRELNEAHGQAAGDVALRRFCVAASEALRDVDVFGRYGGKEFLVLMPDTAVSGAVIAAERVRAAVAREPMPEVSGRRRLSCTLGVAQHNKGENTRLVIGRAEAGLSYAKAAGRDCVVALDAAGKPVIQEAA